MSPFCLGRRFCAAETSMAQRLTPFHCHLQIHLDAVLGCYSRWCEDVSTPLQNGRNTSKITEVLVLKMTTRPSTNPRRSSGARGDKRRSSSGGNGSTRLA